MLEGVGGIPAGGFQVGGKGAAHLLRFVSATAGQAGVFEQLPVMVVEGAATKREGKDQFPFRLTYCFDGRDGLGLEIIQSEFIRFSDIARHAHCGRRGIEVLPFDL